MGKLFATKSKIKQYNSMVDDLRSRLNAIEAIDPDSIVLERYRGVHRKLSEKTPYRTKTVDKAIAKISDLLESDKLTLEGYKRSKAQGIETLHRAGLDYINEKNFNSFMRFLNDAQARGLGALYSSDQIIEAVKEAKDRGLTRGQINENIRHWAAKSVRYDKEGKIIEVVNPPDLKVTKVRVLHPDRRKKRRK